MLKIEAWSQEDASRELTKRLVSCKKYRQKFEHEWEENELTLYEDESSSGSGGGAIADDVTGLDLAGENMGVSEVKLNYAMKYVRFIHAQMSANPPSAIPKPTSQDLKDRRAAEVANDLIQHGEREHNAQEVFDQVSLDSQIYGTGWLRCWFNPFLGDISDTNKASGEVELTGDNELKRIDPWDLWYDYSGKAWPDVRYIFVKHSIPLEQANFMWPQHKDALAATQTPQGSKGFFNESEVKDDFEEDVVDVWEYIEKGLPWNGGVGRYVWMLDTGLLLTPLKSNPFPNAILPVHPLSDIDVPGMVYGKPITSYLSRAQQILTAIDSTELDNIQAHGVVRLVLPDGAEIQDDGISNQGWEYIKTSGNAGNAPFFMAAPALMPDIHTFRAQIITGMEELAGLNESMFGKQSREMSGFSMQTAINAGNMIRRRLFNKYTALVKWTWITYLANVSEYWSDSRKILVSGEEEALSVAYYSAADLKGGFDLQVDYGQSFSLDPASRREEIMQLAPMLKEAGLTPQEILSKIKLNDIKGLYDMNTLAKRRQEEIFEEMIAKSQDGVVVYIAPRDIQEHRGMLDAAYKFVMTKRFDNLPEATKKLIEKHITERESMAAETEEPAAPAGPVMPPTGGAAPPASMPPVM